MFGKWVIFYWATEDIKVKPKQSIKNPSCVETNC